MLLHNRMLFLDSWKTSILINVRNNFSVVDAGKVIRVGGTRYVVFGLALPT